MPLGFTRRAAAVLMVPRKVSWLCGGGTAVCDWHECAALCSDVYQRWRIQSEAAVAAATATMRLIKSPWALRIMLLKAGARITAAPVATEIIDWTIIRTKFDFYVNNLCLSITYSVIFSNYIITETKKISQLTS